MQKYKSKKRNMKRNKNTKTTVTLNYSSSLEKCTKWAYMINDQMQKPNKFQMQNQKKSKPVPASFKNAESARKS